MKKGKRQVISWFLIMAILFGLMPGSAMAAEDSVEWPEAPEWTEIEPGEELPDSGKTAEIYGRPESEVGQTELADIQKKSKTLKVTEDKAAEIPQGEISGPITFIYVNGEAYKGGDLTVYENDNFSYVVSWSPNLPGSEMTWKEGSWFETTLFKVPGLNLGSANKVSMVINGIKVGEYSLTYNQKSGEMKYKVIFNRYIQLFDPSTVMAYLQGSGKFSNVNGDGEISKGEDKGTLTIESRPSIPEVPSVPSGTGWQPSKAPTFSNKLHGFGKGVKWNSSGDAGAEPQIEWRVVFLEQMQKLQQEFLDGKKISESKGNILIEDTLDANQEFYAPPGEKGKYGDAPFFLELPVIVPGTGDILNGLSNIGDGNYDGPGEIQSVFSGDKFKKIPGENAHTAEEIQAVENEVEETPLSWTVTTDPATKQQTLLVNAGKMGTVNASQGVTWSKASQYDNWPKKKVQEKINECQNKIEAIKNGLDSPIALIDQRKASLFNLLNSGINLPQNKDEKDELQTSLTAWDSNFKTWRNDKQVSYLEPLAKENEKGEWELLLPLPEMTLIEKLSNCVVKSDGTKLNNTQEYKNYRLSLENLQSDQRTYLENRLNYGKDWEAAKTRYEKTLEFYNTEAVYGFVMKVRSKSINTSSGTYSNKVNISLDGKDWTANDSSQIRFSSGIIGNYALGDVVLQKADIYYNHDNAVEGIQKVEKDKAGLSGAEFAVYCGDDTENVPELKEENRAYFLDKDASTGGDTYRYTHTGKEKPSGISGDISTLKVNQDGKLILGNMAPAHHHWLVETKAPQGYYLDRTPVLFDSQTKEVSYQMLPNVSRSVLLYKADSYSKQPVKGAEFTLYRVEDGKETKVTGFAEQKLNAHQTYVKKAGGNASLKTNEEGRLCIHGLDAGSYVLRETKAAPGYVEPESSKQPEYRFTLEEELPAQEEEAYDEEHHLLLNTQSTPLTNEPGVAELTLKKSGMGNQALKNAAFTVFRFTGTEEQWKKNPDNPALWNAVDLENEKTSGKYFQTNNTIGEIQIEGEGEFKGQTMKTALTDEEGKLEVTKIPVGHYCIAELKAPETYERDYRSFYFTVNGDTVGEQLKLYTNPEETKELKNNTLKNYQKKAKLALVKYDAGKEAPKIQGDKIGDGWQYTEDVLAADNAASGLEGAVYKLFMRRGASEGQVNPDREQLTTEEILDYKAGYDTCVAVGKTGKNGVLKLSDMKGKNGKLIDGLNPEEYYMIEITAPDGYLLDQTPIHFSLDEKVFAEEDGKIPGLVMTAENQKISYGLRLIKEDSTEHTGLAGAGFEVRQGEKLLEFTGADGKYKLSKETSDDTVTTVFTGAEGKLTITGLDGGTEYVLTETEAPQGYKKPEGATLKLTTASNAQDGMLEKNVLFPQEEAKVANDRLKGEVTLHKQALETMESLSGAEFTLYKSVMKELSPDDPGYDPENPDALRSEDVEVAKGTTDKDGNLTFKDLEWSPYYYLMETKAPEGYLLNQIKMHFSIDETSFDAEGKPITVQFPMVVNRKGMLGEAVLYKADADKKEQRLEDAHFYLEKQLGEDAAGKKTWVGYGQGMYRTDKEGKIPFLLPPGDYKLSEMKAPDGYVLEGMKEVYFTIEETNNGERPPLVVIDDGGNDGVVTNKKGESGVYLEKTLGASDTPVSGVTFQVGWELMDIGETTYKPLHFVSQQDGTYVYTEDENAKEATTELVTGKNGKIYVLMPADIQSPDESKISSLYCQEIKAPDGIEVDSMIRPLTLKEDIFTEVSVSNRVKQEVEKDLSISIHKTDGKSKRGLPGAEFTLYWYDGSGEESQTSHIPVATGKTDKNGNLTFDSTNVDESVGLMAGETYHIVETKAPTGYVLDETHHEVVLDQNCFDENFHFKGVALNLNNTQIKGSVVLKKVAQEDDEKGLQGAEFELLRKDEDAGTMDEQWAHYGEFRYVTDENGILRIENLPYGSYQLIERAAPLGYLLGEQAPVLTFQITDNGQQINLGKVKNEVDPNPVRDVYVTKVSAQDEDLVLPGAQFQLYQLREDGEYHLLQQTVYTTDDAGGFKIEALPVGTYALKEIKAPEGYELPQQNMTYFSVKADEREVELIIKNVKSKNPEKDVNVSVRKVWKDDGKNRPDMVYVQLFRNGSAYGTPVELKEQNDWKYIWKDLEKGVQWTVDEVQVPEGYEKTLAYENNVWVITNTAKKDSDKLTAGGSGGRTPGTGDPSSPYLWKTLLCLAGLVITGTSMYQKEQKKRRKNHRK